MSPSSRHWKLVGHGPHGHGLVSLGTLDNSQGGKRGLECHDLLPYAVLNIRRRLSV